MENTIDTTHSKKLYSSFRAYCFFNFAVLGLMAFVFGLTQIGADMVFGIGLMVMGLIGLGIGYLFWMPVPRRVPAEIRTAIFLDFCITGLLTFAKVLLICTIILIPLAISIGSTPYQEMMITSGANTGERIFVRYAGGNEYKDADGNTYRMR